MAKRKQKRIVVTATAVHPRIKLSYSRFAKTKEGDPYMVTLFQSVPNDGDAAERVATATFRLRKRLAAQLELAIDAVTVTAVPFKGIKHRVSSGVARSGTKQEYNERRAEQYVRWLAERDGIKIPSGKVRFEAQHVDTGKKTRRSFEYTRKETREVDVSESRIRAVRWGHEEERYNERKDGRRGAWTHNEFITDLRIEIPNWDHVPVMTEEHGASFKSAA